MWVRSRRDELGWLVALQEVGHAGRSAFPRSSKLGLCSGASGCAGRCVCSGHSRLVVPERPPGADCTLVALVV